MILHHAFVLQFLLNGFLEDGNHISASTLLECSMMCLDTEGCSSYFYNKKRKLCKPAENRYFSPNGLTSAAEYNYYMMRPDCGQGWYIAYGQCYWYMSDNKIFKTARMSCLNIGGYLARTFTLLDDYIIKSILIEHGGTFWIGGTDEAVEGQWVWGNGQNVTLSLWSPEDPRPGTQYNCLEQWDSGWHDGLCSYPMPYLCQK